MANKIKTIAVKPCPLCGHEPSHIGHTSAMTMGVECRSCGLSLSREYPQLIPRECIGKNIEETLENNDKRTLLIAIKKWNRRAKT